MAKGKSGIHGKAKEIVGQYSLDLLTDSKSKIVDFYKHIDEAGGIRVEDGKIKVSKDAMQRARDLADTLSERMVMRDFEAERAFREMRAGLRGIYTISEQDAANIPDFNKYLRSSENMLRIGKTGTSIDTMYKELSGEYPDRFPSSVSNQAEQLMLINATLSDLKNSRRELPAEYREEARQDLRNDIIRGYLTARRRRRA